MTALPDWMLNSDGLTVADYEALPEEVSRRIEIVDGIVLVSPSPRRTHQRTARRLANALEEALTSTQGAVEVDIDLRLRDVPLLVRRPDIVLYDASLADDEVLRPQHCRLVVEVMSPGSVTTDRLDKPAEYASHGIPHFWRVEEEGGELKVFRYRLDETGGTYQLDGVDVAKLAVTEPVELTLDLSRLR